MCYRCDICEGVVHHGQPLLRHTVHRRVPHTTYGRDGIKAAFRLEVHRELKVCVGCHARLSLGGSLSSMLDQARRERIAWEGAWMMEHGRGGRTVLTEAVNHRRAVLRLQGMRPDTSSN